MSFELKQLKTPLISAVMDLNGGKIEMELDADIITGELMESARRTADEDSNAVLSAEVREVRFMAEVLSKMIKKWSIVDKGKEVQPTVSFFMAQPIKLVADFYTFAFGEINPKKTIEST